MSSLQSGLHLVSWNVNGLRAAWKNGFTRWDLKAGARARNIGWRLDYFFVSDELKRRVRAAAMLPHVLGSDHCPVTLALD